MLGAPKDINSSLRQRTKIIDPNCPEPQRFNRVARVAPFRPPANQEDLPMPISDRSPVLSLNRSVSSQGSEDFGIHLLNRVVSQMSSAPSLCDVLNALVNFALGVVDCDSCMVYVLEGDDLVLRASKNPHPEVVGRLKMKLGQGITGWVAEHKEPVVITLGAYADYRFKLFNELPEDRYESFVSVPILSGGRLVGVINIQNREPRLYASRETALIATLGFLVGAEVERARLAGENLELCERLEARKTIERAKGILQGDLKVSEPEAYSILQQQSQKTRKPMKEIAEAIVLSHAVRRDA
jgi:uroporphyrinogen-III synthase